MSEERKRKTSQQDDSEDESERILEESPCGRWQKRGEEVSYCNDSLVIQWIQLDPNPSG